jgi:hypothetical protein
MHLDGRPGGGHGGVLGAAEAARWTAGWRRALGKQVEEVVGQSRRVVHVELTCSVPSLSAMVSVATKSAMAITGPVYGLPGRADQRCSRLHLASTLAGW